MNRLVIDTEKLAYGLKLGIGDTETIFSSMPEDLRLRCVACGLVSSALHQYCLSEDIPSRLTISTPDLAFDQKHRLQHVLPIVGEGTETVIDASYSQFFGYMGLYWGHKDIEAFPQEEIIYFNVTEEQLAVNWLTKEAIRIQKRIRAPHKTAEDRRRNPLAGAKSDEIQDAYAAIYRMSNYELWQPPEHVIRDGQVAAKRIPKEAITVGRNT